jgi:hypothetical protein
MIVVAQRPSAGIIDTTPELFSLWTCSHLPVMYHLQHWTAEVLGAVDNGGLARLQMPGATPVGTFTAGDWVYVNTTLHVGYFEVTHVYYFTSLYVTINTPYISTGCTGYAVNSSTPNYHIEVNVNGWNHSTQAYEVWATVNLFPDIYGLSRFDVHDFINKYIVHQNDNLTVRNVLNENAGSYFYLSWTEIWTDSAESLEVDGGGTPNLCYFVSAVKQLGAEYGNNLAEYVPFVDAITDGGFFYAKFLTDFTKPTYFRGYPFELAYIISETVEALALISISYNTINYLNATVDTGFDYIDPDDLIGVNRIAIVGQLSGDPAVLYDEGDVAENLLPIAEDVWIVDEDNSQRLTEVLRVNVVTTCLGLPFIRWKGTKGQWNFWRFNKEYTTQTKHNNITVKGIWNEDVENATGNFEVIKKWKQTALTLFSRIKAEDFTGMETIEESPMIQMWVNNKWFNVMLAGNGFKYKYSASFVNIEVTILLSDKYTIN